VIVIFYCANTIALHTPDWKFSAGGRWVKLDCEMGRCMNKVKNHWLRVYTPVARVLTQTTHCSRGYPVCSIDMYSYFVSAEPYSRFYMLQ